MIKLTKEKIKKIVNDYNNGMNQYEIAEVMGVSRSTIQYHLEKNKVVMRSKSIALKNKLKKDRVLLQNRINLLDKIRNLRKVHTWKKGKNINCINCNKLVYKTMSQLRYYKNHFCSVECRTCYQKGVNSPNYNGVCNKNELIRKSKKYMLWRKKIFERDNYCCQICGAIGRKLNAHHIIHFVYCVDNKKEKLIYSLNNGVTLCEKCHKRIHNTNKVIT